MARFPGLKLTARVAGLAKVVAGFRQFDEQLQQDVRREVKRSGQAIRELTQFFVPVRTGHLRSVVREDLSDDGLAVEVGWHEEDFLQHGMANYYEFVEHGTSRMPAQPSLGPAYDIVAPEYVRNMRKLLADAVARGSR